MCFTKIVHFHYEYYISSFFYVSHSKFAKIGKIVIFFICGDHFLRFKEFLLANNTGYDFCLLNILRFKSDREKGNN